MRLALVCAVFAALAIAAPAKAQLETAPTVVKFAGRPHAAVPGGRRRGAPPDCGDRTVASGGRDGGTYLVLGCPFTFLSFSEPQAMVEFFVRVPAGATRVFRACAAEQCRSRPSRSSATARGRRWSWPTPAAADDR